MRPHGRLSGHVASVRHVACSVSHRALASVSADGVLLLWDLRRCLLLHALRICPDPAAAPVVHATAPRGEGLPAAGLNSSHPPSPPPPVSAAAMPPSTVALTEGVAALAVNEDTGETLVAAAGQLQLWSVNGALLAASADTYPCTTSLILLRTPEWMVEQLPIAASGHADGSVRWWVVREPQVGSRLSASPVAYPAALSRLPVRSSGLPAWQLSELKSLRLENSARGAAGGVVSGGSAEGAAGTSRGVEGGAVTSMAIGDGYEKLLWTADAHGTVRSWRVPFSSTSSPASSSTPSASISESESASSQTTQARPGAPPSPA